MRPQIAYANAHDTAAAVCQAIAGAPPRDCMILPRSRFYPESSMWWVVPGKENPAYRYGKLYFDGDELDASTLLCGLHVEKGFGPGVPGPRGHAMDRRWTWNAFFPALGGQVDAQLADLERQAGEAPHVRLLAGLEAEGAPSHYLRFTWNSGTLQVQTPPADRRGFLGPLAGVTDLGALREGIAALNELNWHWINVFVGCSVRKNGDPASRETFDASLLWERLLRCWQAWFR
jgi:hypothetical protein